MSKKKPSKAKMKKRREKGLAHYKAAVGETKPFPEKTSDHWTCSFNKKHKIGVKCSCAGKNLKSREDRVLKDSSNDLPRNTQLPRTDKAAQRAEKNLDI